MLYMHVGSHTSARTTRILKYSASRNSPLVVLAPIQTGRSIRAEATQIGI